MTSQPLFQNNFILRRPRAAIFTDLIKIVNIFIKKIFQDSKKVEIMYQNTIYLCVS